MHSNRPFLFKSSLSKLFASSLLVLGIILIFIGEIWIAPIVFTLGLGLLLKHLKFRPESDSSTDGGESESIAKKPNTPSSSKSSISFWNFPLSRILVLIIILLLAVIDAILFRTPIVDRYNPIGSWQILMGPTLFYPLVFLPLLMAGGIFFHLLFSIRKITLTRTDHIVTIRERGLFLLTNRIHLDHVIDAHFRSNTTGLKAIWIIPWSIQIWGNFASAWHYFTNEFTFGTGRFIGPVFLLHSLIYCMVLILLLFTSEYELKWESAAQDCYLRWYSFKFLRTLSPDKITHFLSTDSELIQPHEIGQERKITSSEFKKKTYYITIGIFLLILALLSIALPFFFSDIPRIFLFMGAIASLGVALKNYGLTTPNRNPFGYVYYRMQTSKCGTITDPSHHTPLEIMLYLSEILQICSIGIILTTKWRIYPLTSPSSSLLWLDLLASSILGIFMLYLYIKKKWDIIEEPNQAAPVGICLALGIGISLSFIL